MELKQYIGLVGQEIGISKWFEIDQERINRFADVTEDWQFIHVDLVRAADTPFGSTVAHGFLTLSLIGAMGKDCLPAVAGRVMGVNYGFDRIRFVMPVRSGQRVRGRFRLKDVAPRNPKEYLVKFDVSIEIEASDKLAVIADWLAIFYFSDPPPL